jgi:hypothetical protein
MKCSIAYMGGNEEYNPFLKKDADLSKVPETYHGGAELPSMIGYSYNFMRNNPVLEGARGCMRECYAHLESTGKLTRTFYNKFRDKNVKPWRITPEMREAFVKRGSEDFDNEE